MHAKLCHCYFRFICPHLAHLPSRLYLSAQCLVCPLSAINPPLYSLSYYLPVIFLSELVTTVILQWREMRPSSYLNVAHVLLLSGELSCFGVFSVMFQSIILIQSLMSQSDWRTFFQLLSKCSTAIDTKRHEMKFKQFCTCNRQF